MKTQALVLKVVWTGWLSVAMTLPGRALHVAVWIQLQAGIINSSEVPVNLSKIPGVPRGVAARALEVLERARLIKVGREPGKKSVVTILDPDAGEWPFV